eukprot:CAMPEP_0197912918 /NCGR_PEP_ID=MMETSP1439-20131203/75694_1 /TAXON_ID=66791 /ORGANISM="Gonyaulax spinifera, Strain CCMP409" /LENGTH=152 /DNA_ID=CAMNT_0043534737 /DNA_START=75 /DNA_END=530 /DNA_ORIENTATION=+
MELDDMALWESYGIKFCESPLDWPLSPMSPQGPPLSLDELLQETCITREPESIDSFYQVRCRGQLRPGDRTPSPSRDERGPVIDGYDLAEAIASYARNSTSETRGTRRQVLEQSIELGEAQAQCLRLAAANPHSEPEVRSHYARVRQDVQAE